MSAGAAGNGTPRRVAGIGIAVALMGGAILLVGPAFTDRAEERGPGPAAVGPATGPPIPAEADVFRITPADLALAFSPGRERRDEAHPRTLATARALRAYPGAPPRVPHGLTPDEFRHTRCGACHDRGGYVARFGAYAPVTPHPEFRQCLQCHAADDVIVGVPFPGASPHVTCLQCHVPDAEVPAFAAIDWRPAPWPATGVRAMDGGPPVIPHDFHLRGNCLACHAGAGAAAEIRTTHAERANCRQCHVPAPAEEGVFTRPLDGAAARAGGGP